MAAALPPQDWKYEAWKAACAFCNVPYARKGTQAYEAVLERYRNVELKEYAPPHVKMWAFACRHVTQDQDFISSSDPRFTAVQELYAWMKAQVDGMQDPYNMARFNSSTGASTVSQDKAYADVAAKPQVHTRTSWSTGPDHDTTVPPTPASSPVHTPRVQRRLFPLEKGGKGKSA